MSYDESWWFDAGEVAEIMKHNRQFQTMPTAALYFHEHFAPADNEIDGEWLSPTAIYEQLREKVGSGLKASGIISFGRYLSGITALKQRRTGNSKQYLVRKLA